MKVPAPPANLGSHDPVRRALETLVAFKAAILSKEFDTDSPSLREAFARAEEALDC